MKNDLTKPVEHRAPVAPRRFPARGRVALDSGFTLVELIMAIVIVAIMLAVGVPALRDFIVSQRVRSAANDLYSDLAYARSEAIKRNAQVSVEGVSGSWLNGWSVKVGTTALRNQGTISDVTLGGDTGVTEVKYNADGRLDTLTSNTSFNFSSSSGGAVSMRCVVITPSGRPAVLVDSNRNGDCQDG